MTWVGKRDYRRYTTGSNTYESSRLAASSKPCQAEIHKDPQRSTLESHNSRKPDYAWYTTGSDTDESPRLGCQQYTTDSIQRQRVTA